MEEHLLDGVTDERKRRRNRKIRTLVGLGSFALQMDVLQHLKHHHVDASVYVAVLVLPWLVEIYIFRRYRDPKPFSEN